jgi:hypothetical protein
MLVGFGGLTFAFAGTMAAGEPLARALSFFLGLFWTARLVVAAFVFDLRPYLTNWFFRLGNCALNAVFVYLAAVYAWTAWKGGSP